MYTNCFSFYFFHFHGGGGCLLVFGFITFYNESMILIWYWYGLECFVWSIFLYRMKTLVYYVSPCDKLYTMRFHVEPTHSAGKKRFCCFYLWCFRCTVDVFCKCTYLDVGCPNLVKTVFLNLFIHIQFVLRRTRTVNIDLVFLCQ